MEFNVMFGLGLVVVWGPELKFRLQNRGVKIRKRGGEMERWGDGE